jgi:hypothetical protein
MTPEERAREIAIRHTPYATELPLSDHSRAVWVDALQSSIADAIREARNAALQEAAGVAENWVDGFRLAARIRALKDKPT